MKAAGTAPYGRLHAAAVTDGAGSIQRGSQYVPCQPKRSSRVCGPARTSSAVCPTPASWISRCRAGSSAAGGEPADVLVVVQVTVEPVRALRHGRGTHLEQQRGAVGVQRAEHDGDVAGECQLVEQAVQGAERTERCGPSSGRDA